MQETNVIPRVRDPLRPESVPAVDDFASLLNRAGPVPLQRHPDRPLKTVHPDVVRSRSTRWTRDQVVETLWRFVTFGVLVAVALLAWNSGAAQDVRKNLGVPNLEIQYPGSEPDAVTPKQGGSVGKAHAVIPQPPVSRGSGQRAGVVLPPANEVASVTIVTPTPSASVSREASVPVPRETDSAEVTEPTPSATHSQDAEPDPEPAPSEAVKPLPAPPVKTSEEPEPVATAAPPEAAAPATEPTAGDVPPTP